jgi:hypothetical protein
MAAFYSMYGTGQRLRGGYDRVAILQRRRQCDALHDGLPRMEAAHSYGAMGQVQGAADRPISSNNRKEA